MLDKYYTQAIDDAIESLKNDGVIIVPTDTLYGLAALSTSDVAINRIYQIKNRNKDKPLPLVVNSYKMLKSVINIDDSVLEKLKRFFPGALTIVAKRNDNFNYYNANTIAVRMIDLPLINKLIESVGAPLALTSANISNEDNISDPVKLIELFDGYIDCMFLDGKIKNCESTIIEITNDNDILLIREGKIPFDKILKEYNNDWRKKVFRVCKRNIKS